MANVNTPLVSMVTIQDLLEIIHRTIIKEDGNNNICVKHIAAIDKLISSGKLKNHAINTPVYWSMITNDIKKNYPDVKFYSN
jgi:hypothetical protein